MPKGRVSSVWQHYDINVECENFAVCRYCGNNISRGGMASNLKGNNTTNLWTHLRHKHADEVLVNPVQQRSISRPMVVTIKKGMHLAALISIQHTVTYCRTYRSRASVPIWKLSQNDYTQPCITAGVPAFHWHMIYICCRVNLSFSIHTLTRIFALQKKHLASPRQRLCVSRCVLQNQRSKRM